MVTLSSLIGISVVIPLSVACWHLYCRVKTPKLNLKGAKILITGGSEGIGLSIAKACVLKGASVAILARNKEKLSRAAETLAALKPKANVVVISVDVSLYNFMEQEIESALQDAGWDDLDAVVCNAGVESVGAMESVDIEEYQRIMNVNYFGVVNTIKTTLPFLKRNKSGTKPGRVLVNCSLLGLMGMAYYSAYSASKWAVRGFVESIYAEMVAMNIYLSIVYPPDVKTSQLEREKDSNIPQSVKDLSAQADVFEPDDVGRDMVKMLEHGEYTRSWGMDGCMLLNETAGFGITHSIKSTFTQVFAMGLFRGIAMWYIQDMYRVCRDSFGKKEKKV